MSEVFDSLILPIYSSMSKVVIFMKTTKSAVLFDKLNALYDEFACPGIYTDKELRQETLDEIRQVQDELRERHGWNSERAKVAA